MQYDEHKNTQKWRKTEHKNNFFCSFFALSNSREKKKLSIRMVEKLTIFNARLPLTLSSIPFCYDSLPHVRVSLIHFLYPMTLRIKNNFYGYYFNFFLFWCWSDLAYGCRDESWSLIPSSLISCPWVFVYSCPREKKLSSLNWVVFVLRKGILIRQLELILYEPHYLVQFVDAWRLFSVLLFLEVNISSFSDFFYLLISIT